MTGTMVPPMQNGNGNDRRNRRGGRKSLVHEAVQLLSSKGMEGMSIGKLAERTGYSKGGIMAHFSSKREMVLTLVDESVAMARAYFRDQLKNATSPTERLSRTLVTYGEYWTSGLFEGGCPFVNLAVDAVDASDEVAMSLRRAVRVFISDFANVVRIGQATGEFSRDADADEIGERLMALCVGCGWTYRMTGDPEIFTRMQPAVDEIVRKISRRGVPA
ncbi:TetR/AcrR family transcriptional regulator [bacterium]|nr:TetR/AcrR family transcriptional regulator [bacterium]